MKLGISTMPTDESIHPCALAPALEERGFDSLFVAEHSHVPANRATPFPGGGDLPREYYRAHDPFVALTAAAAATSTLAVGTGVLLLAQRDAIQTAKEVASIDHISGGRFLLVLGLGWNLEEAADHGVQAHQRGKLLDEKLTAMKALWRDDEAEFHGPNVDFDSAFSWPKPVQKPHPPIYFGGYTPVTVTRARRHQAGWMPVGAPTPELVPVQMAMLAGATDIPVNVVLPGAVGPALLEAYRNHGVERATITLPSKPEPETLPLLDEFAALVETVR